MTDKPPVEALRLLNGFRAYQLVVAACQLNLPDLVADGHSEPAALAAMTGTDAPAMRRVLRGLTAWGFFHEDAQGRFTATAISDSFRSDRPGLRGMALMLAQEGYRTWAELAYVLRTGNPAYERVYGMSRWQKMAEDPEEAALFNAAMVETSERVGSAFVAGYELDGLQTVVDVAGGNGALLAAVLAHAPHVRGVLFDLPAGLAGAAERFQAAGLDGRVTLVEGSFFDSVPASADLYLLKSIVHDWDDERAIAILKSCRGAMKKTAKVVLLERFLPERIDSTAGALGAVMSDLHMMVMLGGRERTTSEYKSLLSAAALRMTRPIVLESDFYAIEAVPLP